jgi:hypothetical protein
MPHPKFTLRVNFDLSPQVLGAVKKRGAARHPPHTSKNTVSSSPCR